MNNMIFGVGVDILAVSRISILEKTEDQFFISVFTDNERSEAASRFDPMAYYAGRFAAKEAVYRACACPVMPASMKSKYSAVLSAHRRCTLPVRCLNTQILTE